jgi:outer membrane protein assembly factor BamB
MCHPMSLASQPSHRAGRSFWSVLSLSLLLSNSSLLAQDWHQWRGPDRTGHSKETGLLKSWPEGGPKLLWTARGIGTGNSTPSVSGGKVFGLSYRGNDEIVWALEAKTGKEIWSVRIAAANFRIGRQAHDGSGSTPTIDGSRLYALGTSGDLVCMETSNGKIVWRKNLVSDFGGSVPQWGYSESPLVDGDRVIATPGGATAGMVALNKATGDVIWKARIPGNDDAGYSSVIIAMIHGQKQYVQFMSGGVVGVEAVSGRFSWRYDSPANGVANCSTPIYVNGAIFAASGYNTGGGLAKITKTDNGMKAEEVFFTRNMRNHHGNMVLVGDYIYGFDESNLTCLNVKTGEIAWRDRSVGKGSVSYADGFIYARSERGPIALVQATPRGYVEKGRFETPNRSGKTTWTHPVIADGKLYLRDHDQLFCYDIRTGSASSR